MRAVLSRIPAKKHKAIAGGLLYASVMAALFASLELTGFTRATKSETSGWLWWQETTTSEIPLGERLPYLLIAIGMYFVAIAGALTAARLYTLQGGLKKYSAILVGVEAISIQKIADITNSRATRVLKDIQAMIDSGLISDFYIDYGSEQVVSKKYIPASSYKTVVTCSGCGGRSELIVGITKVCNFCKQPLVLEHH